MSSQIDKQRSVFSALLTFEVDVTGDPEHPRWEAQVVVLPADDESSAKKAATRYGRGEECTYENVDGRRVSWKYLETLHVEEVIAAVAVEPTEVMSWPIYDPADLAQVARLVTGRAHQPEATATVLELDEARTRRKAIGASSSSGGRSVARKSASAGRGTARKKTAKATSSSQRAAKTAAKKSTAKKSTSKKSTARESSGAKSSARGSSTKSASRRASSSRSKKR